VRRSAFQIPVATLECSGQPAVRPHIEAAIGVHFAAATMTLMQEGTDATTILAGIQRADRHGGFADGRFVPTLIRLASLLCDWLCSGRKLGRKAVCEE